MASNEALRAAQRGALIGGRPGALGRGAGTASKGAAEECKPSCPPTEPLFYHQSGGVVEHNPVIHVIFWGKNWNEPTPSKLREQLMAFYEGLSGSSYQGILTQYFDETGYISPNVTVSHPVIDESVPAPVEVTDGRATEPHTIEHEVAEGIALQNAAAEANKEPKWVREPDAQFVVIIAPGATFRAGFLGSYCAYHSIDDSHSSYAWVPDAEEHSPVNCQGEGKTSRIASHEYAEMATDPYENAWQTRVTNEVGDVCQRLPRVKLTTKDKLNGLWVQRLGDDHLEATCALSDPQPPHVLGFTESASLVGLYEATLNASAYAENLEASYELKYGKTTEYEHSISAGKTAAGVGFALQELHEPISGLEQGTLYHYRVLATNSKNETTQGADQTFTTKFVPPTVTKVEPSKGAENGGTAVTITGTYLLKGVKTVKFGSSRALSFVVNSETSMTAVSPPGAAGQVDVTVTNPGGTSPVSSADKFEYAPFPIVSGVELDVGPQAGGSTVTITGTNLNNATAVKFGSVEAASFNTGSGALKAVTPPGSGVVEVTVTNPTGSSATNHGDRFAYEPPSNSARSVAWGDNSEGALGNGGTESRFQPGAVAGLGEVKAVSGELSNGVKTGVALLVNGTVDAWGGNERGGLGDGTTEGSLLAGPVSSLSEVIAISGGDRFVLALLKNRTVKAWGSNLGFQLGDSFGADSDLPVSVCAVSEKAGKACSNSLNEVSAIAAGEQFSLAVRKNGTVVAWGSNGQGQLGNGGTEASPVPVTVSGLSEVSAIAAGNNFALALLKNGTVKAWGGNTSGQLGTGSTKGPEECSREQLACSKSPVPVSGLSEVSAIAAGNNFAMALLKNGTVKAWGPNESGELGNGGTEASPVPVPVSGLSEVGAISAGGGPFGGDSLALLKAGTVKAWGANVFGQLGDGNNTGPEACSGPVVGTVPCSKVPVLVNSLSHVSAISAGSDFNLAIGRASP
jgi:alpha-tubulin suppressor-like RCC1 family protein